MGKTYRSWQKRDGWREDRHREAKRKNHFVERKDRSRLNQERTTEDEHLLSDQEPA